MIKEESDLIITEEILKAVAKVKSDYHELCNLKDMRIANLEKENADLDMKRKAERQIFQGIVEKKNEQLTKAKEQLTQAKDIINCLVHLGEFNENTVEEYLNYQVHDALKRAEQFLKYNDDLENCRGWHSRDNLRKINKEE